MIILCQGYFKEQMEELVSLLLYTAEDSWREHEARALFLYPVSIPRVNYEITRRVDLFSDRLMYVCGNSFILRR